MNAYSTDLRQRIVVAIGSRSRHLFVLHASRSTMQFIAVEDIGKIVTALGSHTIEIAGDTVTGTELAGTADVAALRQAFPGLLMMDAWLAGAGRPALLAALQADGGDIALR